jgi:putative NIF3 family GTP cyclohydrolase 1 type 2
MKNVGFGRIGYLNERLKLSEVVEKVKSHLKMKTFRLAIANNKTIDDTIGVIAVCAGSGSKLLNNLNNVDLLITGEFPHHEILHEVQRGTSLIVTDHTNTERGFATVFKEKFNQLLSKNEDKETVTIDISAVDRDPLEYV